MKQDKVFAKLQVTLRIFEYRVILCSIVFHTHHNDTKNNLEDATSRELGF